MADLPDVPDVPDVADPADPEASHRRRSEQKKLTEELAELIIENSETKIQRDDVVMEDALVDERDERHEEPPQDDGYEEQQQQEQEQQQQQQDEQPQQDGRPGDPGGGLRQQAADATDAVARVVVEQAQIAAQDTLRGVLQQGGDTDCRTSTWRRRTACSV